MEDSDIVHTIMAVKEMLYCGYRLNPDQADDLVANAGILTGDMPYIRDNLGQGKSTQRAVPKFHTPNF